MSEWITDRLPDEDDAFQDWVFVMNRGNVELFLAGFVTVGMPWQPIVPPDPYVKPKRWTLLKSQFAGADYWYVLRDDQLIHSLAVGLSHDDALRIIDIYDEVMP